MMRLVSFDYFRGIAILFIVAGHSYGRWVIDSFGERVLANLISGGTALFVFISGFFFHHIYYKKFNFKEFMEKKGRYVIVPYLIWSVMGVFYYLSISEALPYSDKLGIDRLDSWINYVEMFAIYLWTGRVSVVYWYIPFILIIFIISPLFIRYIHLPAKYRIGIFIMFLILAMLVHRPATNLSPIHSVVYFLPIYMLGINCSMHREKVMEFVNGKSVIMGLVVLFISAMQILFYDKHGSFHKEEMFSYGGVDVIIIQKIAMCFFFLSVLQKCENRNIPILKLLASASFAIFFIHPWVIEAFSETRGLSFLESFPGMGVFIATFLMVVACSILSAYIIKFLLRRRSRYVIGW